MKYSLSPLLFAVLAGSASAASVVVDSTGYLTNIGGTAAGSQGNIVLDPSGVLGWANWNDASLTPSFSGGSATLTLTQVGSFTLSVITDNRFRDAHGSGPTTDTIGVRGNSGGDLASSEGFRISFIPGAIGSYKFTIHTTDFGGPTNWAVNAGATSVGSGVLPNSAGLDEGRVVFNITVANATEAAASWNFNLTAGTGATALTVNGASLVPEPGAALLGGLGLLALLRRRR